jgi:hypothetical protein
MYDLIIHSKLPPNTIEINSPHFNWTTIWQNWMKLINPEEITQIHEYFHDAWWTGEMAFKKKCHKRTSLRAPYVEKNIDNKNHLVLTC